MTWNDLTDTQVVRITRKRVAMLCKRLRARRANVRRMKAAFEDLKATCIRLGAWDRSA